MQIKKEPEQVFDCTFFIIIGITKFSQPINLTTEVVLPHDVDFTIDMTLKDALRGQETIGNAKTQAKKFKFKITNSLAFKITHLIILT